MFTLRRATEKDANIIAGIHVASWQKIYRGHLPDELLDSLSIEQRYKKWFEFIRQGVTVLLIEKDKVPVGFASLCASRDSDTDSKTCGEISAIYILPEFWRQGLGKKLCVAALNELGKKGFTEVILWVLEENTQACKFYEAIGFTNTGKIKVDTLKACTLGVIQGKETECNNLAIREIRYLIKLPAQQKLPVVSKQNTDHFLWGVGCEGWWLFRSDNLVIIEERMPPHTTEKRHYHIITQQFFYVLQGALIIEIEGNKNTLSSGQGIFIPAGYAHNVLNESQSDTNFIIISPNNDESDRVNIE